MSANGNIEIAVTAEGAEDAADELAQGGGGGGGGMAAGGGGGGLRSALKGGIIGGLLSQALGPLLDVLNPILQALTAFLAPLAVMLLRLFQPVLRLLFSRVLPAWLNFMSIANSAIPGIRNFIAQLPQLLTSLPGRIWSAISTGASWLANGAVNLASAIWSAISTGASWLVGGAANIASAVWTAISDGAAWITSGVVDLAAGAWDAVTSTLGNLKDALTGLLDDIWSSIRNLPGQIANSIKSSVPGLASGGIVSGPTLAQVGEAGPEAVIPLDRLEDILGRQQGGTNVQISGGLAPFVESVNRDPDIDL